MENRIIQLRSMPYDEYLKTPEWAAKREQALERDGRHCRLCNTSDNLQVHHRTYLRRGNEDLNDLTTLCKSCHEHFHKKVNQDEIMTRTYMAPIVDPEKRHKENIQKWEYFLIGMLLQHPDLYPCVCGILPESDFIDDDARSLYAMFNANADESKSIQERIPQQLESAAAKAVGTVNANRFTPKDKEGLTKTVVQTAIRVKEHSLLQSRENTKMLLDKALKDGDKDAEQKYGEQLLGMTRQLHTLKSIQRLHQGGQL
jgi:hypothetical protein